MYIEPRKKFAFVAIPRTASKACAKALQNAGWEKIREHHEVDPRYLGPEWRVFYVVRHPYSRMFSMYRRYLGGKRSQGDPEGLPESFDDWLDALASGQGASWYPGWRKTLALNSITTMTRAAPVEGAIRYSSDLGSDGWSVLAAEGVGPLERVDDMLPDVGRAQDALTDEACEIIAREHDADFVRFGFDPDPDTWRVCQP